MANQKVIPIFFAVNDRYAAALAVALKSLIINADQSRQYQIIVLYQELSSTNQRRIGKLAQKNVAIQFFPLQTGFDAQFDNDQNTLRADYRTLTIYYRLFIADMFPQYDKAIYLDADIIVTGDISSLFDKNIDNNLMGAVNDRFIALDPNGSSYAREAIGVDGSLYVNSGVLLLNLDEIRQFNLSGRFLDLLRRFHFDTIAPDQDYLNAICQDRIFQLDPAWNYQTAVLDDSVTDIQIIHFNLFNKPWHYQDAPFNDLFWNYASETTYLNDLRDQLNNFSAKNIHADLHKQAKIIQKAGQIAHHKLTLNSVIRVEMI